MSNVLNGLNPKLFFKYFEEISLIPRESGNEKAISNYLVDFAKNHNLEVIQDEFLNVIIRKPGSNGYENSPVVIIQGHMDMVCEKNQDTIHDFSKDPIQLKVVDDMIYAADTTLGADNGVAVAYSLALLASNDIPHPPLEVILTSEEETTMNGAISVDPKHLRGKLFINLDQDAENTILVGSAGGADTMQSIQISWEDAAANLSAYKISIRGLKGGHSGAEIHNQRANANKLIGRILNDLSNSFNYFISKLDGGLKSNAIPRESDAVILIDSSDYPKLENKINEWNNIFKNEYRVSDPNIVISINQVEDVPKKVFSEETKIKAITTLVLIPNGVQTMSLDIDGLVESSTNIGVVTTLDNEITFDSAVRSSVKSLKLNILSQMKRLSDSLNCKLIISSDYPEWEYNPNSKLRDICKKVHKDVYKSDAKIEAIHAGLECGLFTDKIPGLDAVSIGPNVYDIHTPNEHMSISSASRTWNFLLAILKEIK